MMPRSPRPRGFGVFGFRLQGLKVGFFGERGYGASASFFKF